jgi:AcrR family transcriptional regulator
MPAERNTARSPWVAGRDRAAEREEKLEAVLRAAARAFSEHGYHRTSLDGIAERLGITKPTLYYYAASKEDLIAAVVVRAMDQIMRFGPPDLHASGLIQLKQLMRRYAEVVATDFGRCLVLLNEADFGEPLVSRIRDGKREIDGWFRRLIDKGQTDGSIAPCDTRLTAFMLGGAINGIARWYDDAGVLTPGEVAETYVNQLATGLMPRSSYSSVT